MTEHATLTAPTTRAVVSTVDPATGQPLAEYPAFDDARVEAAVGATHAAGRSWAATPLGERLDLLRALADTLRAGAAEYAALISAEMGKPRAEAAGEIEKSAVTAEYYAANASRILSTSPCRSRTSKPGSATSRWA